MKGRTKVKELRSKCMKGRTRKGKVLLRECEGDEEVEKKSK